MTIGLAACLGRADRAIVRMLSEARVRPSRLAAGVDPLASRPVTASATAGAATGAPAYKSRDYTHAARSAPGVSPGDMGPDHIDFPTAFGVELEMDGTSLAAARDGVAQALGKNSSQHHRGVVDEAGRLWEVKPDEGSVVEIASPVLHSLQDLRQVQDVAQALQKQGAVSHARCGTHFHVDARGMELPHMLRLLALLARHEQHLYKALRVHPYRARYCMPMQAKSVVALLREPPGSAAHLCNMYRGPAAARDRGLNVENLRNRDGKVTLEFRYFNGTLNAHVLGCYAGLVMGLMGYAVASRRLPERSEVLAQPNLPLLLQQIGMPPAHPVANLLVGGLLNSRNCRELIA